MAIEIVDLPSYKMVISHIVMLLYQRVTYRGLLRNPAPAGR